MHMSTHKTSITQYAFPTIFKGGREFNEDQSLMGRAYNYYESSFLIVYH